jgi:hypothetical protein
MAVPYPITTSGNVGPTNTGTGLRRVVLTPAAAVATLVLREGGSGGRILYQLQAAANGNSVTLDMGDDPDIISGQLHATIGGAGAFATVSI